MSFGSNSASMDTTAPTSGNGGRVWDQQGTRRHEELCISLGMYSARHHEVMGGVRISAANRSRVTPYGALTVGAVNVSAEGQSATTGGSAAMMGSRHKHRTLHRKVRRFPGRRHRQQESVARWVSSWISGP